MIPGYALFLSSIAGSLSAVSALSRASKISAVRSLGTVPRANKASKKGSFLLKTPPIASEAARIVAEKKRKRCESGI